MGLKKSSPILKNDFSINLEQPISKDSIISKFWDPLLRDVNFYLEYGSDLISKIIS